MHKIDSVLLVLLIAFLGLTLGMVYQAERDERALKQIVERECPTAEAVSHELPLYVYVDGRLLPVRLCLGEKP